MAERPTTAISHSHDTNQPDQTLAMKGQDPNGPHADYTSLANQQRSTQPEQRHIEPDQVSLHHTMTLDDQSQSIFK